MRFIRVHGRVVPVKDGTAKKKSYKANYGRNAAIGALAGASTTAGALASTLGRQTRNVKAVRFGSKAQTATTLLGLVGTGMAVKKGVEAKQAGKSGVKEAAKHYGAQIAGSVVGAVALGSYAGAKVARGIAKRNKFLKVIK